MVSQAYMLSLIFLAGFACYSAIHHFTMGRIPPRNRANLLFAAMCLLSTLFIFSRVMELRAETIAASLPALRLNTALYLLFNGFLLWFFAEYTEVRPAAVLVGLTLLFAVLFIVNLTQPYGLLRAEIHGIERLTLPWGEEVFRPLGESSAWGISMIVVMYSSYVFPIFALVQRFRRDRKRSSLVMLLALGLYAVTLTEGLLFELVVRSRVPLGVYGFAGMIIAMSLTLNYEIAQSRRHLQVILDHVPAHILSKDPEGRYVFANRSFDNMYRGTSATVVGKTPHDLFPEPEADALLAVDRRVLASGQPLEREETSTAGGRPRTYYSIRFPLFDLGGMPSAMGVISLDITERKRTEDALRESEQRYREIYENTSDGLFVVEVTPDQRYRLLGYNPAQEKMLGISNAQAAGRYNEDYLSREMVDIVNEQNRQCIAAGRAMTFENALDLPAGRSHHHTTLVPIRDAQGRIHRLVGLTRDMTEIMRTVEALRQSEEKFSKAFHGSPDSITISRLDDGVLIEVNQSFMAVYGYSREEVVGRSSMPGDLGIWVDPADRVRLLAQVKEHGEATGEWMRFRRKDGTIRHGLVSWSLIEIDGVQRILSITRDMTERKRMEEALRDSEARFRLLAENSTDLISRHAPDGTFLYASPSCTALLGYFPEQLIGSSPRELFHREDLARIVNALAATREKAIPVTVSYRIRRRDGTFTWLETVSRGIRDPASGEVVEIQASSRDISERMRAQEREREHEQQLFQASKLASLGTLVSGIAHEINNPNNYIRLNSQNLEEFWGDMRTVLDEAASRNESLTIHGIPYAAARDMVENLLRGIGEGSKRIERLLLNLRDFARGDEGGLNEMVELNGVVRSGVMIVQNLIQKSTDSFSIRPAPSLPAVRGNYHQLEQVVINLVTNACQALPSRERKIEIETMVEGPGEWVALTVRDEGIGIPESNIPRVADPFFTTKRAAGGSGLGLAVSSRIVQNHGGTMSFSSVVGKGT